ncbi:MAG: hypothetical protein ABIF11_00480 [Nitrospirota bacterium]
MKKSEELKKQLAQDVQCQLICGDGTGKDPKRHYSNCPNYVPEIEEKVSGLPHDQLLQALYFVFDFMDRALINFYLVGDTAASVRAKKDLFGDRIMVAVRKNEWDSGARRIADAFAPPLEDEGGIVRYEYKGVPIILYVLHDSTSLTSADTTIYANEYFKLPNPYDEFIKEFEWLK